MGVNRAIGHPAVDGMVQATDAAPGLKVVTFESANPDYFLAH